FRQRLKNQMTQAKLKELKLPTLLISGVADLVTPPSISRMIAAELPDAELAVASESGHSVYWEQPDVFNRAVLDFVGQDFKGSAGMVRCARPFLARASNHAVATVPDAVLLRGSHATKWLHARASG